MKWAEDSLSKWSSECNDIALGYFHICESALCSNQNKMDQRSYFILLQLATSCQCATESSILLVRKCYFWEAEILIRAVVEATIKYVYLCIGDESERTNKATEYLDDLPIRYQIKQHNKAKEWLAQVENPEEPRWKPIRDIILNSDKLADLGLQLEQKYPTKQDKKRLEQKWSIHNILQSIRSYKEDVYQDIYKGLYGVAFGYDIGSHIAHQDADCIGLMWDRVNREPPRKEAVEKAHVARELHDLVGYAQYRAVITRHMLKMDMKPVAELSQSCDSLSLELEKARLDWFKVEYGGQAK